MGLIFLFFFLLSIRLLWALGKGARMLFSGAHFTKNSVCLKVCGWGIVLPSPDRKTGFETLTVGVRELETHIPPPPRKWGYRGGLVEMRGRESTCKKVQLGLARWLSGWKCFSQAG